MFKRIEIWILYLTIIISIFLVLGYGVLVRQGIEGTTSTGNFSIKFLTDPAVYIARLPERFLKNIGNDQRVNDPWDNQRYFWQNKTAFTGDPLDNETYLLLSRYEESLGEFIVELIDLRTFKVEHTWNPDIKLINSMVDTSNPEFALLNVDRTEDRYRIWHPYLNPDGSLIFHGAATPLIKIGYCGELLWQNQEERFHHAIEVNSDGDIWVASHMYPYGSMEKYVGNEVESYLDDAVTKVSQDGKIIYTKSVSELFIENGLKNRLFNSPPRSDPIHLNDIEEVEEDGEYWKKGDIFLSLRNQSMILLYRPSTNKILWIGEGPFFAQHDVDILNDHQISIYNNNFLETNLGWDTGFADGYNEMIIYDFSTDEFSNYLEEAVADQEIITANQGLAQILSNGDLYMEETYYSRALYFNADGALKWEYVNITPEGNVYPIAWTRILFEAEDIAMIKELIRSKTCDN